MAQTAAQGFNFLLVGNLLPLGQFEGLQHFVHILERGAERGNNAGDLFNGLLNRHRPGRGARAGRRGSRHTGRRRAFRTGFRLCAGRRLAGNVRLRSGSQLSHRRSGWRRRGCRCLRRRRRRGRRCGSFRRSRRRGLLGRTIRAPPGASPAAAAAPPAPVRTGVRRRLRGLVRCVGCRFRNHRGPKVPGMAGNAMANASRFQAQEEYCHRGGFKVPFSA